MSEAAMAEPVDRGQVRSAAAADSVAIVTSVDGFEALAQEWNALSRRIALPHTVFQDHGFLRHWLRHYGSGSKLALITARRAGRLICVLPLVRTRRFGMPVLAFMGVPIARFTDALIDPEAEAGIRDAVLDGARSLGAMLIEAPLVRRDSALERFNLGRDAIASTPAEAGFALLARRAGREGPGDAYDARTRSNYRRRLRRLSEAGALSLTGYGPGPEAAQMARRAIAFKKCWLSRNGMPAPTVFDPRFEACFADVAADTGGQARLQVSTIERDGHPIGIDLSFDYFGHTFGHVIAAEKMAEQEGAGGVLVHHVLSRAKGRGSDRFELLTPLDEHKRRHADGVVPVRDLYIPLSPLGRLASLALAEGLPLAKSMARRLPANFVRAVARRAGA